MNDTKSRILDAALMMFADKGYAGTNLRDLALTLGITKTALYRHFESKEAIFNAIIDANEGYYQSGTGTCTVPDSFDELISGALSKIDFTMHDPKIKLIRKLIATEQYRNERMANLATKHFVTDMQALYTVILQGMIDKGIVKPIDASLLAIEFFTPVSAMIQLCDRDPSQEPYAMQVIKNHFILFCSQYKTEG